MKPETLKCITKAKDSLLASPVLADQKFYDFAAARAYYTMFYIASAFLWEQDLSFSSHSAVISAFGREIAKQGIVPKTFHRYLIQAQNKRTQGDYGIEEDAQLSAEDVATLIEQSQQFIEAAKDFL